MDARQIKITPCSPLSQATYTCSYLVKNVIHLPGPHGVLGGALNLVVFWGVGVPRIRLRIGHSVSAIRPWSALDGDFGFGKRARAAILLPTLARLARYGGEVRLAHEDYLQVVHINIVSDVNGMVFMYFSSNIVWESNNFGGKFAMLIKRGLRLGTVCSVRAGAAQTPQQDRSTGRASTAGVGRAQSI